MRAQKWPGFLAVLGLSLDRLILRATPTAAGPSCCKRSVLRRTHGFGTLDFEYFVGAVSGAYFVRIHMILKVCVYNMMLNYASRNHPSCVGKIIRNGPKIGPKRV